MLKLFAGRPLDLRDAEGVAIRNHGRLDWELMESELKPLAEAKEDAAIFAELERLRVLE